MTTPEKILRHIDTHGPATFYELLPLAGTVETISRHVLAMLADGKLREVVGRECVRLALNDSEKGD